MSQPTENLHASLDAADAAWELLAAQLEQFIDAWEANPGQPPAIAPFAPDGPPGLRRMVLAELVKVDLDYRWHGGEAPRLIEQYLEELPELAAEGVPCDLLYEELHIRQRLGERVPLDEYFDRFPDQASQLERLLGGDVAVVSTALFRATGAPQEVQVGDRLDDFDLLTQLGSGAFATVFLARQRSLQRLVALKISANQGDEPQTLAQLDHPHIVRVYDQRLLPDRDQRLMYMQYVAGGTLQEAIRSCRATGLEHGTAQNFLAAVDQALAQRGETPPVESPIRARIADATWPELVCWLGAQLAEALDYAHAHGVLHRDLKPANILLTAEGSPKLVDFNISFCSKVAGATPAAYFGGSLAYMSPEQLEASNPAHPRQPEELDGRSDLYSLGIVLWELLTGSRPFRDEQLQAGWSATLQQMTARRQSGVPEAALAELPAAMPPGLREVLLRCLAPHPENRSSTGNELAQQLRLCLQPAAQALLHPSQGSYMPLLRNRSLALLVAIAVVPNAAAALFNLVYNDLEIIRHLSPASRQVFMTTQATINLIAFSVGIGMVVAFSRPVTRAVGANHLDAADRSYLAWLRARCVRLGQIIAVIGIVEWIVAGAVYPLSLQLAGVELAATHYLHFMISLTLCGVIAATYPFFGATALALHALYPALLGRTTRDAAAIADLRWADRASRGYLYLAAALPMLAVAVLVLFGREQRLALGVLSVGGVLGFGLLYYLARMIQNDVEALADVLTAAGAASAADFAAAKSRLR